MARDEPGVDELVRPTTIQQEDNELARDGAFQLDERLGRVFDER